MTILQDLIQAANEVYGEQKVLRDICIIQGIHESSLLTRPSDLATKYYNLFGIKKKGTLGWVYLPTWEVIKGKVIRVKAGFGCNKTVKDSVLQHQQIMQLSRYHGVREAKTFEEAAKALVEGGYATDLKYSEKLIQIHDLDKIKILLR